ASPWWDAGLTAFSLVAQCWMAQKRLECWALWIAVDVLFVALFASKALYLTAALYALFTLLSIHGWRTWRRDPALREGVAA
ncbi:nicotinamide riboside transporter PnuC, partial [Salmonella sp. SAL4452]|uniref:nicotinamide riboside transporter PnuC n=1 Tax=Salmonella sp. SAL4452 TaxID=3159907 RepID=UPI00397DD2F9